MDTKQRIIEESTELFFRKGIRAVTMNDVAEALGISKRTLYEQFHNKEELLATCIDHFNVQYKQKRTELERDARNPVDIIHRHFRHAVMLLKNNHPGFAAELKRFHPRIWKGLIQELLREREEYTIALISEGVRQGFFRGDTEPEIAAKLLHAHVDLMSDTEVFPPERFSQADLFRNIVTGFLRSLATEKGLEEIENLFYNNTYESYV